MDIKKYVENRRAELRAERASLEVNSGGITMGRLMAFDQRMRVIEIVLAEMEFLANWEDDGEPQFRPPLDASERAFWLKAKALGVEIPAEVAGQL